TISRDHLVIIYREHPDRVPSIWWRHSLDSLESDEGGSVQQLTCVVCVLCIVIVFLGACFRQGDKLRNRQFEGMRNYCKSLQRDISLFQFDITDVGSLQSGTSGKPILCQSQLFSALFDGKSDRGEF